MRRVFEIDPILCPICGVETRPMAVITDDAELGRLLAHVGLPTRFPKTKPARSLPAFSGDECQVDPGVDAGGGIDEGPEPNWAAA
ncbi:MAG: hypothetical protein HY748_08035 [Elusimicrobia bacterium]|nr:hypothetical protein [Elusimicrobiota bacterium]